MPGQSNNTTILTADNQLIITQNEQTTELNDIEQAILSLKAVIASSGGNGGNSVSGDGPTGIQDMIGIDPLEDFTQEQSNNRCTIANFIFDGLYGCADELGDGPLQGLTTLAAAITTGIPMGVLVATVFVGSPVILGVAAGVLVGAIAAYIASSGDFADIADEMLEQKQAIINDLYRSKDVYEAKAAFVDNCSGLSSPNKMLLDLLCGTDILKVLFISNFEVPAGYSPTKPCEDLDDNNLGEWVALDSTLSEVPGASTRYYDYFELEAVTGTVFGGGGWPDRYYLLASNTDTYTTTKRRFTIDCLDSSYTISGISVADPLFYSQAPLIQGNTIVPTIITPGKVYEVTGCNYVRVDTIQGSAGLKMRIEVAE